MKLLELTLKRVNKSGISTLEQPGAELRLLLMMLCGTVTCVDASSGKVVFVEKLGVAGTYFASPLAANQNIYFTSFSGKITIIKNTPQYEMVNQIDLKKGLGHRQSHSIRS